MNPYLAKRKDHHKNLLAAKERFKSHLGIKTPTRPVKPYSIIRDGSKQILLKRVESVKHLSSKEIDSLVHSRHIYGVMGVENMAPLNRNRVIHSVLATAGKVPLRKETIKAIKEIREGIVHSRIIRDEPYLSMLEVAGIVDIRKFKGGGRKVFVRDKKRLEETIREGKIIW